jgi:hypothetical protein
VVQLLCMTVAVGVNVRWQRKNKIDEWFAVDIVRFSSQVASFQYLYVVIAGLFGRNSMLTSYGEWYVVSRLFEYLF